jgi:hypothetical protein
MPLAALFGQARKTLKATALIAAGQRWSAEQLAQRVEILAGSLRRKGVRPGDRVALHMLNIPELVVAYCACFGIGAIVVPLNARHKQPEIERPWRGVCSRESGYGDKRSPYGKGREIVRRSSGVRIAGAAPVTASRDFDSQCFQTQNQ